ncbi:putative quinol monooxygenase [Companilactobacillus hulinensis]|uniref:putative quinol monooxygenase n=1 Tax=Companilactobacillus hulinensis TaxID=2486007 RepID=UPI000F767035|nr:antibiotic biosynthesis monooxygenase [Companilactobacillus hulinensis]
MIKIAQEPLFRLFKLRIKSDSKDSFTEVGRNNLLTSIKNEPGTMAMYTGHIDDNGTDNRVLELYKDQANYQIHADSPQFADFKRVASSAVVEQSQIPMTPLLLVEQGPELCSISPKDMIVRLIETEVDSDKMADYKSLMKSEIRQAIVEDKGLLVTYLGKDNNQNQKLILFEVYNTEANYQKHLQSNHFQKFQQDSKSMITKQENIKIHADAMVNQGQMLYER